MTVLVSGSSGLIGSALVPFLSTGGHQVLRLQRPSKAGAVPDAVPWDPQSGQCALPQGVFPDAVVHLAGESIAEQRWNDAQKQRIRESRVQGTRQLCQTLTQLEQPPAVLLCASAVGFYGDRGDEMLTEQSDAGTGFLAEVCREWEAATQPAIDHGIRVIHLRFGVVLSPRGGALAKMLRPFKMGMGGRVGSGRQFISFITIDDAIAAIAHCLATESLRGPVNIVSPHPVSNLEFTKTLARVLGRPALAPLPAFAARAAFGEMANELLLASTRAQPKQLQDSGYAFRHPDLESGLRHLLGKHESSRD